MRSVAINYGSVPLLNCSWMINNYNLGNKLLNLFRRIIESITCNIASLNLVGFQFDIESNIISWVSNLDLLVMHLNGFYLALKITWSKYNVGFFLKDSRLNSTNSDGAMTLNFVNIVDWNSKWFLGWSFWSLKKVNGLD